VANAIAETYRRKKAYQDARTIKEEAPQMLADLQAARDSELKAEHAFREHTREHGCKK